MKFILVSLIALFIALPAFADSDLDCQVISAAINPTEAQATPDYINLVDGTFSTSESAEQALVPPVPVVVWGIRAQVNIAPGAGDEWRTVLRANGVDTALECTISGTETTCQDTNTPVTIAAGTAITMHVDSSGGATDPSVNALINVSACIDLDR